MQSKVIIQIEAKSPQFRRKVEKEINEFLTNVIGKILYGQPAKYSEKNVDILIRDNKENKLSSTHSKSAIENIIFTADGYYQMDQMSASYFPEFTKPLQCETLVKVLHTAIQRVQYKNAVPTKGSKEGGQRFIIQNSDTVIILKSNEITFIKAWGKYCHIYTTDGVKHIVYKNMGSFSENIVDKNFVQCHKSFIVNISHIRYIQNDYTIKLTSGVSVPLARRRKQTFINILSELPSIQFYLKRHPEP